MRRSGWREGAIHRLPAAARRPNVDAVHINSPIADHAPQSIAALRTGKHVASTVAAETTIDECRQIVVEQRQSGKGYMMMETVVYSREYLFVKDLYDRGELGRIQLLRGSCRSLFVRSRSGPRFEMPNIRHSCRGRTRRRSSAFCRSPGAGRL